MKMKKILSSIIAVCLALSSFGMTSYAATEDVLPEGFAGWDEDMVVTDGTKQYKTLVAALEGIHLADSEADVLYCKPGADVGTMTHGHVCDDLTVYGNGAYVSGGETDFELDTFKKDCAGITEDIDLTVYNLDGCSVWGGRTTEYVFTFNFVDCDDMSKFYVMTAKGTNNVNFENCSFDGSTPCAVFSNAQGTIKLDGCTFTNVPEAINLGNKSEGVQTITVKNCDFIDCGFGNTEYDDTTYAAPIRVVASNADAVSKVTVDNCDFRYTDENESHNGDILLGDGRVGEKSYPVEASIVNTAAEVQIQNPGDRTADENKAKVVLVEESETSAAVTNAVAEVAGEKYCSFKEALAAADAGDIVKLLADVAIDVDTTIRDIDVNLNGKTMTLSQELSIKGDCEIFGGKVVAAEGTNLPDGLIRVGYHSAPEVNTLTMTDATVVAENVKVSTGVFYLDTGCAVTLNNVDVTAVGTKEDDIVGVFYRGSGLGGDVTLTNGTTITTEKVNAVFYRVNLDVEDTTITCTNNYKPVFRNVEGTVANTSITVTGPLQDEDKANPFIQDVDGTGLEISFSEGTSITIDETTPLVAEGNKAVVYVDSTVTIPESDAIIETVATVNGKAYASVAAAAADAKKNDVIVIYKNIQDLAAVVNDGNTLFGVTVKLGDDFDLAGIEWTPIGTSEKPFKGKFDGQNHKISNLKVDGAYSYAGFFGYVTDASMTDIDNPTIKDLYIEDAYVKTTEYNVAGGLSGQVYLGTVKNVHVTGTITGGAKFTGGLVGHVYASFDNCSFEGEVNTHYQSGGIAGGGDGRVYNSKVVADVYGGSWVGGVIGNGQEGTSIVNCYVEADVYADYCWYFGVGGLAGVAGHGYNGAKVENNYFNGEVYLAGEKIDTPVIGFINADSNDTINSTVGGNSWNTEYYPADLEVIITAESSADGKAGDYATLVTPAEIQERNNNLVMLESDLEYVDAVNKEDVVIMDFSNVTEDAVEEAVDANVVAVVDGERFASFDEAFTAADPGDTIDLVDGTIVLAEKKINKSVTIKNGTISLNPTASAFAMRALPVTVWTVATGESLTLENVTLIGNGYNTSNRAVIYLAEGAKVEFINSSVDLRNDNPSGGFIKANNTGTGTSAIFNNTDVYLENTGRGIQNIDTLKINNSDFTIKGTTDTGIENAFNRTGLSINGDSIVDIDGCSEHGIKMEQDVYVNDTAVLFVRNSGISDIMLRNVTDSTLYVAPNAKVYADFIESNVPTEGDGEITSSVANVYVQFKKVATTEESITYDIIIAGNGKTINRLTTADLTFAFASNDALGSNMSYVVTPKTGVTLTPKGANRYMFNFNGIDNPDETGKTVTIGQVEVSGFGTFTFKVDDSDEANITNLVNATEVEDNIVDHFVPGGAENKGTLVLGEDMVEGDDMVGVIGPDEAITIPQRELTINIAFPNKVEDAFVNQKMSVTIKGGQYEEVIDLEYENMVNGGYVITRNLDYNTTYMVTVEGAGYRTARYSVVMTDHKTLNFWNNVKSDHNKMEIESGVSGLTAKNFLAGDIVKDNAINIWDLNAVVSFFGTASTEDEAKYVRYDLNRDGKIDSKDVAYVLVSWGE